MENTMNLTGTDLDEQRNPLDIAIEAAHHSAELLIIKISRSGATPQERLALRAYYLSDFQRFTETDDDVAHLALVEQWIAQNADEPPATPLL